LGKISAITTASGRAKLMKASLYAAVAVQQEASGDNKPTNRLKAAAVAT
jgi:hypothetical protein